MLVPRPSGMKDDLREGTVLEEAGRKYVDFPGSSVQYCCEPKTVQNKPTFKMGDY